MRAYGLEFRAGGNQQHDVLFGSVLSYTSRLVGYNAPKETNNRDGRGVVIQWRVVAASTPVLKRSVTQQSPELDSITGVTNTTVYFNLSPPCQLHVKPLALSAPIGLFKDARWSVHYYPTNVGLVAVQARGVHESLLSTFDFSDFSAPPCTHLAAAPAFHHCSLCSILLSTQHALLTNLHRSRDYPLTAPPFPRPHHRLLPCITVRSQTMEAI
jgi:hypothetical protein